MKRVWLTMLLVLALVLSGSAAVLAQGGDQPLRDRPLPDRLSELRLDSPVTADTSLRALDHRLAGRFAQGHVQVVVRLREAAAAEVAELGPAAQLTQATRAESQHGAILDLARQLDPSVRILGTTRMVLNSVMLDIDAAALPKLTGDGSVLSIKPVVDYQLDLSETVPYIGATPAVQNLGFRGKGIKVAVLDSGIDYTHAAFGGPGTLAAYEAAYGASPSDPRNTTLDGLFPTARVVGGYDFVGEAWPSGPLAPDPDPIDFEGHGTHVADIIGGGIGVAPEVDLYAVKVCSAVSSVCSGVALINAMEFATDPNGDGDTSDHVDIINMSLGAPYGIAYDDDLSNAVNAATSAGVLTVAAAGNGSDKPYVLDTPGAAFTALSVAQTQVPSAFQPLTRIISPTDIAGDYAAVFQPWSAPLAAVVEASIQYGGAYATTPPPGRPESNTLGCEPYPAGSLTGKIVLVDRGICNFSLKILNIQNSGGLIGIIGLVAPGDPFEGGFGGDGPITIPGYMISQADSSLIKGQLEAGVVARFDPANSIPLVGHMVGSSSRGPNGGARFYGRPVKPDTGTPVPAGDDDDDETNPSAGMIRFSQIVKPEIGAPGASVSAIAGTGNGTEPFGGTSGATPMVSGAAALLINASHSIWNKSLSPLEVKSKLMNTAETNIMNRPVFLGGDKAPITRIGGGELRVDRAINSPAAAWEVKNRSGALSFGFVDVVKLKTTLWRTVIVHNYSDKSITYNVNPTFRFDDDKANGAVTFSTPSSVKVPARGEKSFTVTLFIDGAKLREWSLNSGSQGANGNALTTFEYDGYLVLDDQRTTSSDDLHLAWQVLPRLSSDVRARSKVVTIDGTAFGFPAGFVDLTNMGVGMARVDSYSLVGISENRPATPAGQNLSIIDLKHVGVATYPDGCGQGSFAMSFAISTWERQSHANAPGAFEINLDIDRDGTFDYQIFNFDLSLTSQASDGRNVTFVDNLKDGSPTATANFFTDHGLQSGNTVLTICSSQIGMSSANYFQQMDVKVDARDWASSGTVTDSIEGITLSPLGERYLGLVNDIPSNGTEVLTVLDFGASGTNPSETGVLLILDAARAGNIRGGAPAANEAIVLPVVPPTGM